MNTIQRLMRSLLLASVALNISACDQVFTEPLFEADGKLTVAELDYFLGGMIQNRCRCQRKVGCLWESRISASFWLS